MPLPFSSRARSVPLGGVLLAVLLGACDLTNPGPTPVTLVVRPGAATLDALGGTLNLSVLARGEAGETLQGVPVEWHSDDPEVVSVTESGVIRAERNGTTTITARFGDVSATASIEVRQVPRRVDLLGGDEQAGPAGALLPEEVRVQILDRLGTAMPGTEVRFVASHGGTASPAVVVADAAGFATTVWTLGPEPGTQHLAITVDGRHTSYLLAGAEDENGRIPFRIRARFLTEPGPAVRDAFDAAIARWEPLFAGKLAPVLLRVQEGRCGENAPALDEVVDDLLLLVTVEEIDGPGGVAALSAPCFLRQDGLLPVAGQLRLDAADVGPAEGLGILEDLIAHEIGHVLGVGSLWDLFELLHAPSLPDAAGADTHFSGPLAIAAFDVVGGAGYVGAKVPVENELGGEATRDRHWRQSVLGNELMTSFLSTTESNPLSLVTVRSLEDLGYAMDADRAEPWALASVPPATAGEPRGFEIRHAVPADPVYVIDRTGRAVRVLRR